MKNYVLNMAVGAKKASLKIGTLPTSIKNKILNQMASQIEEKSEFVIRENAKDIELAKKNKISDAVIKRLILGEAEVRSMADGLRNIAKLKDPIGEVIAEWKRPNGLKISKVRVSLGVIAVIYESRPNVTVDCVGLCFKSGNVSILRGGKEALNSNKALFSILLGVIKKNKLPSHSINFIDRTEHSAVGELLKMSDYVNLVIPRGGETLIKLVVENSRIPVIKHYKGICHTYVDKDCDIKMAERICINAKVQKPAVCNAMETLLVHEKVAKDFLPGLCAKLKKDGVEIRGCTRTKKIVKDIIKATEQDWKTEYLDKILSIKIVTSLESAIEHISKYGSMHSDAIVTKNIASADKFTSGVDSACVFVNASTRFSDGGEFGFGAEIGISTDKFHARGPMGIRELTSYKYIVNGAGQIRE